MSESKPEPTPQSDSDLIQVAAMLSQAAANDERMSGLAKTAREMVLKSDSALLELFAGYLKSKAPPPARSAIGRNANAEALALVNQAKSLIEGQ